MSDFRLSRLLKIRVANRDQVRIALAGVLQQMETVEANLDENNGQLAGVQRRTAQQSAPGPIRVEELVKNDHYMNRLDVERQALLAQKTEFLAGIGTCREKLLRAEQQVQILENLRKRHLLRGRRLQATLQNRNSDEHASRAAQRPE